MYLAYRECAVQYVVLDASWELTSYIHLTMHAYGSFLHFELCEYEILKLVTENKRVVSDCKR